MIKDEGRDNMEDTKKILRDADPKLIKTVTGKILSGHLVTGTLQPGAEIGIRIDQTLTQDATGTVAYLEAEVLGIDRAKTELSVSYVDHNTLKIDHKNADDHTYLQSVAAKYGLILSKAGNGICHQVHLESYARPGKTLLGSDSHTPTAGGIGCMGIGAGGLDVALAIEGEPFYLKTPEVIGIRLTGRLKPMVAAKDVILAVLQKLGVNGGVGKALEYFGPGVKNLTVPERATITNMGAETGATTSIFPSDEVTLEFMHFVEREAQWVRLEADEDVVYDEVIEINMSKLVPLIAKPHSPGNVVPVREVAGIKVDQVCIGSCTNSSLKDLMTAAYMLKGKRAKPEVSFTISPGSMSVYHELARIDCLTDLIAAGARILECTCGPCIGQGQAPRSGAVSVRTFNRNFKGRSGTPDANIYLSSVETAVSCALTGVITDPRSMGELRQIPMPDKLGMQDALIVMPPEREEAEAIELFRGPNIKPIELRGPLPETVKGPVLIKLEDNISTDIIMPAGIYLGLRSNVPEYAKHVFEPVDPDFDKRALAKGGGFVIAGENYGQGSSREHAALCPAYLGVRAVIVKSFARIHLANLINFGIIPLTFKNSADYDLIEADDELQFDAAALESTDLMLKNITKSIEIPVQHTMSSSEIMRIKAGGTLAYISKMNREKAGK